MNIHITARILALLVTAGVPFFAMAQSGIDVNAIEPYSQGLIDVINDVVVPLLLGIAFLVFLWGLYKYFIWNNENEVEKMEGRKFAMWGIIGFVIIFSVWALVGIVKDTFSFDDEDNPTPPTFQTG